MSRTALADTAVRMLATHHEFVFFSRDYSPLSAMLHRSVLVRAPPNRIARIDSAVKNRAMNRTKIFAIFVGALNAAVPVRGQDNVEPDCRGKRSTAFAAKRKGKRRCHKGAYER